MKTVWIFSALLVLTGICLADYQIIATFDAPDTNISGLGFGNGSLWAVDKVSELAYELDPTNGTVQNSWYCDNGSNLAPAGLTFADNAVCILTTAGGYYPFCYQYSVSGYYLDDFDMDC